MDISLGQSLAAFISAGLGAFLAIFMGASHKQLCALISFAAGTLLSATLFHIVPEARESGMSLPALSLALASGYALFFVISRYVSHMCPACSASHFEHHHAESKFKNFFFLMAIALTIHSLMDGMAIALTPHLGEGTKDSSIFMTIAIHKLPEGLALCALLLKSGQSKGRAFVMTLIFEFSTVLGWALGFLMLQKGLSGGWVDFLMVHIAGGFVYLALHAVINEMKDHSPRFILLFFLFGFAFMALVH